MGYCAVIGSVVITGDNKRDIARKCFKEVHLDLCEGVLYINGEKDSVSYNTKSDSRNGFTRDEMINAVGDRLITIAIREGWKFYVEI